MNDSAKKIAEEIEEAETLKEEYVTKAMNYTFATIHINNHIEMMLSCMPESDEANQHLSKAREEVSKAHEVWMDETSVETYLNI